MPTKLSKYCEGIMEAVWLAAVVAVPAFFDVYSSRIFEPDKLTFLRSLALLILAAWIVKLVDGGGFRWERLTPGDSPIKSILHIPLIVPVVALAVVYLISTLFSVTPRTSFWGSYQRLQGTYTTFSYMVVFAAMIGNLRRRIQVERLITTVILVSLPISLYGILQRYQIDPVPWGGDVSNRIASNMGNSIFVAAYLIMVSPLTIGRIVDAFNAILNERRGLGSHVARATVYVFICALQAIALFFSGSRGPWLGWMTGSFFLFVFLSLLWHKRWLTLGIVGTAVLLAGFLVILNIPKGPLESLRSKPGIGRLGQVFSAESRTGQVRVLIWSGAAKLVAPHQPLEFPDGKKDVYNFLRILIGYGPESMYVAYNPFYPPDLGHVEKRNASPDRSHNETWDSLVTGGIFGLVAYLLVFATIFYYGLKWLGLVTSVRQRNVFIALFLGGGAVGAVGFIIWRGIAYLGVGLPFGIILGLIVYLTLVAVFASYEPPRTTGEAVRTLTLAILLAAVVAHFVEINFGIAIAATRTYFWTFSALILVVGYILPKYGEFGDISQNSPATNDPSSSQPIPTKIQRSKRQRKEKETRHVMIRRGGPTWLYEALAGGFISAFLLSVLGYAFISNSSRPPSTSISTIIQNSVTRLPNKGNVYSLGVLALILTTWLALSIVFTAENKKTDQWKSWLSAFGITLGTSGILAFIFWSWHAGRLAVIAGGQISTLGQLEGVLTGLLTNFYVYAFVLIVGLAFFLPDGWPSRSFNPALWGVIAAPITLVLAFVLINYTNLRIIHADIEFKMAEPYTKSTLWPTATKLYKDSIQLAPDEDYYYLFIGRSYLEQAKTESNPDELVLAAEEDLKKAQKINPLNTDHTANLARLYSWWASRASDSNTRNQRGNIASEYYARATTLSPHNSNLWIEWSQLYMDVLRQPEEAYRCLTRALELDSIYSTTQGLMGDYYFRTSQQITDTVTRNDMLEKAVEHYTEAIRVATSGENQAKMSFMFSLGNVYIVQDKLDLAITTLEDGIKLGPKSTDLYRFEALLAQAYYQKRDNANALIHAKAALSVAPEAQKQSLQDFISQLQASP